MGEMFRQQYNLPGMIRVMPDLAIDRLHYRMRFAADGNCASQVHVCKRFERTENASPTLLP